MHHDCIEYNGHEFQLNIVTIFILSCAGIETVLQVNKQLVYWSSTTTHTIIGLKYALNNVFLFVSGISMGLYDILLPALCFNVTCFDDLDINPFCFNVPCPPETVEEAYLQYRKNTFRTLASELEGQELIVTTVLNGGLSGVNSRNGEVTGTGVAFEILDILKNKYKFNYTIKLPHENEWGSSHTGVLGLLVNDEADLSAAFLPVLADFFNVTTYSPSLDMGVWVALMKRPKESATGSGLLAPFTLPVWMLVLVSLLTVGPIIYLLILLKARLCKDDNDIVYPLPACFWFVYGALLKQGTTLNPVTDSSRILFATWWIFITILTAFYTANLTAFLTLSKFTLPINQADDIGIKNYKWVTNKGNAIKDIIKSEDNVPNDSKLKPLGKILGKQSYYANFNDSVILTEYVQRRDMIFIREKPIVEYVMYDDYKQKAKADVKENLRCTFVMTKFNITAYPRAFAYSKKFKYNWVFDSAIRHLVESGIIKFKLSASLPDAQICPLDLGNKERQLSNSDLSMTYIIVGIGFSVASIVFSIELLIKYHKYKKNPRHRDLFKKNIKKGHNESNHLGFGKGKEAHFTTSFKTPPPPYNSLFMHNGNAKKTIINGREYWMKNSHDGQQLVPVRTPSALLFQYTN